MKGTTKRTAPRKPRLCLISNQPITTPEHYHLCTPALRALVRAAEARYSPGCKVCALCRAVARWRKEREREKN